MKLARIDSPTTLHRLAVDDSDWNDEPPARLLWMAQLLLLIRRFEETLLELKGRNLVHGPVHSSIGQEAVAVGAALALRSSDTIVGTHRAHHQYLAKVLNAMAPADFTPLAGGLTTGMQEAVRALLGEIMGLRDGCCGGRGGSMHLFNPEAGVMGTNAIVGGGIPMATGVAWANRMTGRDGVTVCFFGDGAVYQGTLHESANLAALWKTPIIYFIENNQFAVATRRADACSAKELADVAQAYGMRSLQVDGMDPLAVMRAVREVVRLRTQGWLPCFVEADTYRFLHHAGGNPGSAYGYRSKEEERRRHDRDPLLRVLDRLRRMGILDDGTDRILKKQAEECISRAVDSCTEKQGNSVSIRERLWPRKEDLALGLRSDADYHGASYVEAEDLECRRKLTYVEAIAAVTGRWLEKDSRVVVLGEEVANLGGGAYGATKGLHARFPGRLINTPISEAGFSGLACGAAMNGLRPIVEIMFSSFALVAADQLFNQIGQLGYIYGGRSPIALVARMRVAIGLGYGAQHSLDPAALFSLFPGWRIFAPATAFDYIGLFNAAMLEQAPTLIIEHHELYGCSFTVPDGAPDHLVRPARAKIVRRGDDCTVLAYSATVSQCLQAAEQLARDGIDAEVIDLRTLDDAGVDYRTIGESLEKTGALAVVEQAPACNSIGPKISAECLRRFFDSFDCPPALVAAPNVPIPVSRELERACIPTTADIVRSVSAAARREQSESRQPSP